MGDLDIPIGKVYIECDGVQYELPNPIPIVELEIPKGPEIDIPNGEFTFTVKNNWWQKLRFRRAMKRLIHDNTINLIVQVNDKEMLDGIINKQEEQK